MAIHRVAVKIYPQSIKVKIHPARIRLRLTALGGSGGGGARPVVFNVTGQALAGTGNLHYEAQLSLASDFSVLTANLYTGTSQTNWYFWNGTSVQPFPAAGLPEAYRDAEFGLVAVHVPNLTGGTLYWARYRSFDGVDWSEYRVRRVVA